MAAAAAAAVAAGVVALLHRSREAVGEEAQEAEEVAGDQARANDDGRGDTRFLRTTALS